MKNKIYLIVITLSILMIGMSYQGVIAQENTDIEKEVIVVYKNEEGKQEVLEKSVEVDYEFETVPAVSATVTNKDLKKLTDDENIDYIEENITFSISNSKEIDILKAENIIRQQDELWNIKAMNIKKSWEDGYTGKDVNIAVLDTGISSHNELHISGGISTVDYTKSWQDDHGHGTHVSGIIATQPGIHSVAGVDVVGVAPDANLFAVKVLDHSGEGNLQDILEGLDWAIANQMDIINMSLQAKEASQLFQDMIDMAYRSGIIVVASSGNDGNPSTVKYPAKYDSVIAVSSVNDSFTISSFASTGTEVEFSAPGEEIISTYINGNYAMMSGTSQAAPHVSGILAVLKQKYPTLSNNELREVLQQYVIDLGPSGKDSYYGYGMVYYDPMINAFDFEAIENAMTQISLADQTRTLWDYDSARYTIQQLPDGTKKKELIYALKTLQEELGLVEFQSIMDMNPNQQLLIRFNKDINPQSVHSRNVFIRKNGKFVENITFQFGTDQQSVIVYGPPEGFLAGQTYFLYIDRTILSPTGIPISNPVVVMFKIK
ncbi:S8 family peptidase [Lederbergia citri]|uniref:S8 family peptidase n=1 Tax=Lederbergia citri TaxID=2833580 RepID=A0A942TGL6_9BACI|nr:S8 family peptidase [Lederbergia citri]MBS4195749.1 S8 family peptidase [Lederbergia citri]